MNLPFFKKFNKKIVPSYYLVLVLRDEKTQAVIFEEIENKVRIVGQKEEGFSASIDEISQEELLEKLDKAISSAESSLPENIQTQKTIFGVKESWTDNDQIKKEYLAKLKKTSEELGLIPIGFLVISQAISHLLQKEEGVPVSAILTEINKKNITVTLLRAGKRIETKSSEIHENIPFTVDTLLKHFNTPEILPSRIILFNGKEDFSQEFISHTWSKSLPFLHLPQITNLPAGFDAKAVLFGATTQMGLELSEEDILKAQNAQSQQFGETQATNENFPEEPILSENLGAESFGFTKEMDVAKMEIQEPIEEPLGQPDDRREEKQEIIPLTKMDQISTIPKSSDRLNHALTLMKDVFVSIFVFGKKINIKKVFSFLPSGKLSIVIPAILFFFAALIACYFLFLRATIMITVDPKITEQNKSILFSTIKATNPSENIIKGEFISVSEDGSSSTPATGKKDVGTPAKGTVIIYNDSDIPRTLVEGTILKAPNSLEFKLDSSIAIKAIASHSANENPPPEKATANVTANQLGKESNLPSGTKFNVASFDTSELIAINDNPFSGGTKKEVTIASKDDSVKLEEILLKQLENNAKQDLQKKLDQNKNLLPALISKAFSKKSLNVKVGDETDQLTLTGTVDYQGLFYDKGDLVEFSKSFFSKNIPSDQTIDYDNIKTTVMNIKNKNDEEIEASLNIKALLLPKIDKTKLAKTLKGKTFKTTEDLLYKISQIADVKIKLSPNLPFLPKSLPSREKNIEILIKI